jgi:predicted DNA-binding transcriptional regulator AlpA
MTDRIVREPEATTITGLSRVRRYELAKDGLFPRKFKLSERASGYKLSELMEWLESRPRSGTA